MLSKRSVISGSSVDSRWACASRTTLEEEECEAGVGEDHEADEDEVGGGSGTKTCGTGAGEDQAAEEDEVEGQVGKVGEDSAQDEGEAVSVTVRLAPANGGGAGTKVKFSCSLTVGWVGLSLGTGFASPTFLVKTCLSVYVAGSANGGGPATKD